MKIKDKNGQLRIMLDDFKKKNNFDLPLFIEISVEIKMDSMSAKEQIDVEISDFKQLSNHLKLLESQQIHTFYFQPIDQQLQIKFESLMTGNIRLSGFLKDKMHLNKLSFEFETSPIELFKLHKEIEGIIKT